MFENLKLQDSAYCLKPGITMNDNVIKL